MKIKMLGFIAAFFLNFFSISVSAQTTIPTGKARLIEFTNDNAQFSVPDGKAWIIYSVFSYYLVDGVMKYDEYFKEDRLKDELEVRVFLKDLNGVEKTNLIKNVYGLQLYRSVTELTGISYPIIFTEKTTFNLILIKGELSKKKLYNGAGYISLMEIDN